MFQPCPRAYWIAVRTLCRDPHGQLQLHTCSIPVNAEQYARGEHYDLALDRARHDGLDPQLHADADQIDFACLQAPPKGPTHG